MPPEEQTRLRRCRACRPRKKQDFGVAEHGAAAPNVEMAGISNNSHRSNRGDGQTSQTIPIPPNRQRRGSRSGHRAGDRRRQTSVRKDRFLLENPPLDCEVIFTDNATIIMMVTSSKW